MRTGANFDRPPPGMPIRDFMAEGAGTQPGQAIAAQNMYSAGIEVVRGIARGWDQTFARGVAADNYVGDILGSLGGGEPDFGTPSTRLEAQRHTPGSQRQKKRRMQIARTRVPRTAVAAPRQEWQKRRAWQERRAAASVVAKAKV